MGANDGGSVTAYHHAVAAQPTSPNLPFVGEVMFRNDVDFFTTTGAADHPFTFANFGLEATNAESGVPTMVWRSVGNSHTEFARESAIDELAIRAGATPSVFACSGFLSHSAQMTEVSIDDRNRIHVERVMFVLDCGIAVNPDLLRAQVEGGILWGLSAVAYLCRMHPRLRL
jgi:isoquinoline 1-oxidoreductase subunit beta